MSNSNNEKQRITVLNKIFIRLSNSQKTQRHMKSYNRIIYPLLADHSRKRKQDGEGGTTKEAERVGTTFGDSIAAKLRE